MPIAAAILIVALVVGALLVVVRGLSLWRALKRARRRLSPAIAEVTAGVGEAERSVAALERRRAALSGAQADVVRGVGLAATVGAQGIGAFVVLRPIVRLLTGR